MNTTTATILPVHEVCFMLNSRDYGDWRMIVTEWNDGGFSAFYVETQPEWGAASELDEEFTTSPTVEDLLIRLDEVITTRSEIAHEHWLSSQYSY
jgi:hypothetical protein